MNRRRDLRRCAIVIVRRECVHKFGRLRKNQKLKNDVILSEAKNLSWFFAST